MNSRQGLKQNGLPHARWPQEDKVLPFIYVEINLPELKLPHFNVNTSDHHESIPRWKLEGIPPSRHSPQSDEGDRG